MQRHGSSGFWGGLFGGSVRKSYHFSSAESRSRGSENAGKFFKMFGESFKATNPLFTAERSDITAHHKEFKAGVNHHQSLEQSSSSGPIWNRVSVTSERHDTHVNPHFARPVYLHKPDGGTATTVIVERVRGSGAASNLYSDTPIQYRDMDDTHEHHHHSQKSLTGGAAMIVKLAVAVAAMYATPLSGALGGGIPGAMVSAGVGTLCGDTAVCLIENDGDLGRTMSELGKRDVVKNVARSMLAAGLVQGITDLASTTATSTVDAAAKTGTEMSSNASGVGSSTSVAITTGTTQAATSTITTEIASKSLEEYAKQAVIQSAVNTALSIAMDGQDFAEALKYGIAMAGINTLAAYGAGKIGDLYKFDAADRINYATHKALHGLLGGAMGVSLAAVTHTDLRIGALSGALGAVIGEMIAEGFSPDKADIENYLRDNPSKSRAEVESEIMGRATKASNWGAFVGALGAFGLGLDVAMAHAAGKSATENNNLMQIFYGLCTAFYGQDLYNKFIADVKAEGFWAALEKLGIRVVDDTTIAMAVATGVGVAPIAFEVGGVACKTLAEALRLAKASPTATQEVRKACQSLERNLPEMEQLVQALRPTARQSERDIGLMMGDAYKPQISFKDGGQIRYGLKGSTRPDFIFHDLSHCIEVKNYLVSSEIGISRLVNDVTSQALKRQAQLPNGMAQHVFIDIRGQTVSGVQRKQIVDQIAEKTNSLVEKSNIRFME